MTLVPERSGTYHPREVNDSDHMGAPRLRLRGTILLTVLSSALGSLMCGCYGVTPDEEYPATPAAVYDEALPPATAPLRRLTKAQFQNVLTDLFGEDVTIPALDEPDTRVDGLVALGTGKTTYSSRAVNSLEKAALGIADQVLDSDELRAAFIPCASTSSIDADCARSALAPIARHTWRRAPTDEELDRLVALTGDAGTILEDFHQGLRFGLAAILQSPHFLFRSEVGETVDGEHTFTDVELASRLSFFLWNSGPDAELLAAAEDGELSTDDGLLEQAQRLLDSPRARDGLRSFFIDYLQLQDLDQLSKDPTLFDHFDPQLGLDAKEETLRLLEHLVFDEPGDFRDLMTTRTTFVNPRLAALYAIPAPAAEGFHQITLDANKGRRGLLGHASFLNQHAHKTASSPTLRGKGVRTILLCQAIPAPPVDVDTSIPEPSTDLPTLRDRVQEHMDNPGCRGCHELLDPIGLGLENYDAVGRWRDLENDAVIDASGELDGTPFENPSELAEAIRNHEKFVPCVVETLVRYARGREESSDDQASLDVLTERFAAANYDFKSLVLELISSPLFRRVSPPTEED